MNNQCMARRRQDGNIACGECQKLWNAESINANMCRRLPDTEIPRGEDLLAAEGFTLHDAQQAPAEGDTYTISGSAPQPGFEGGAPKLNTLALGMAAAHVENVEHVALHLTFAPDKPIGEQPFWTFTCPCGIGTVYSINELPLVDTPSRCGNPNHWAVRYEKRDESVTAADGYATKDLQ